MTKYAVLFLLVGCATPSWVAPQPTFSTKDPADAMVRIAQAVQQHCGGVRLVNEESSVVIGNWAITKLEKNTVLTQCIVTLLNGDEQVRDVRVTFGIRHCENEPAGDLDEFAKTCARENTVPESLYKELVLVGERIEADVSRR
ncbi:MAG: hypothetical protein ACO1OB_12370 [Archangium sp.]